MAAPGLSMLGPEANLLKSKSGNFVKIHSFKWRFDRAEYSARRAVAPVSLHLFPLHSAGYCRGMARWRCSGPRSHFDFGAIPIKNVKQPCCYPTEQLNDSQQPK